MDAKEALDRLVKSLETEYTFKKKRYLQLCESVIDIVEKSKLNASKDFLHGSPSRFDSFNSIGETYGELSILFEKLDTARKLLADIEEEEK